VLLPFEERVTLPVGQYFVADLMDCSVFESPAARPMVTSSPCSLTEAPSHLGRVRDVQFPGEEFFGTPLLEVETSRGNPDSSGRGYLHEDRHRRTADDVLLPDGLRDLNQP